MRYRKCKDLAADKAAFLAAHPPPSDHRSQPFLTPELAMHRTFTRPLDSRSSQNPAAAAARDWAIRAYILFKRVKSARDTLFTATVKARRGPSPAFMELLEAQRACVRSLVAELTASLEAGRHYHTDFRGSEHVLARVGSPFYYAVSIWASIEGFLQGFENGAPRFVEHVAWSKVGVPRGSKNRMHHKVHVEVELQPIQEDPDSSCSSSSSIF
ncbi:hypothetical protein CspeluHIS016_0501100 [Cutaneotrichosporon spelunceum]|uniref:Uncharacterized protein n=1 Tax=Cutaneotrichosporon spelunceum TaxID=1672016 RepID=A0AAD3TW80_9TREE|nr:hypothetical protein CspeluHIS016_0501100 [Cutaneotrichosporon spelunceum]